MNVESERVAAKIDVRATEHEGETIIALMIDENATLLTKSQAKHLARLLVARADGTKVYSQQSISETVRMYSDQILHDFIPQTPELQIGGRLLASDFITRYHQWRKATLARAGIAYRYPVSNPVLGRAMKAAGFGLIRSNGKRYYVGISVSPVAPSASDERGESMGTAVTDGTQYESSPLPIRDNDTVTKGAEYDSKMRFQSTKVASARTSGHIDSSTPLQGTPSPIEHSFRALGESTSSVQP